MQDIRRQIADLSPERRKLLEALFAQEAANKTPTVDSIPHRADLSVAPLSFAQQRMWLLSQFEPENPLYTMPIAMRLTGALDREALQQSLDALVRRHASLRTTFATQAGQPVQRVAAAPALPLPLPLIDLQDWPAQEREAEAQRLIALEAGHVFDLATGPLLRARLLRLEPTTHILLMSMHHIIADGWSVGIVMHDLAAHYAALVDGTAEPLPPLAIQYPDYARWQRERLEASALARQLAYWRSQLAGAPVLQLPTDHPRPAVQSYQSACLPLSLSSGLSAALGAIGQRSGATLFMTLSAAFTAFLHRLSGQPDFCVGALVAGRNHPDLEGLIGFFVNNLALRTDLSGAPSVAELLVRVRTVTVDAYANQDVPFEQVLSALPLDRAAGYPPLFQVMCVLQNFPRPQQVLPGLALHPLRTASRRSGFDLTLWLWEDGARLTGELEYNPQLFAEATITRLAGHLRTLLTQFAADPARPIRDLPLLSPAEQRQLVVDWNATGRTYPLDERLHDLFAAQAVRTPDAVALVAEGRRTKDEGGRGGACPAPTQHLTYGELNARARRLADHLRGLGVGPETRVAICMERSPELLIGLLGILMAGGAYVPLDPSYPSERLQYMLADSRARVLVINDERRTTNDESLAFAIRHSSFVTLQTVDLRADWSIIAQQPETRASSGATPDNLAYIIYTSGSTGRPKGAMNTHRGIVNRLRWMQQTYQLDAGDSVLQKTPLSFDVSVWELFWPLISGARLVLARPGGQQDSAYLAQLIARQQITTLHFVPSMLEIFVAERDLAGCRALRRVICSGEALAFELQERFFARLGAELHNLYGPTEAAIDVTAWRCRREDGSRGVPIGRPIANTQVYILDRQLRPAPIGIAGELYIGGVQLARGYLARPDLTAERFIPNPFVVGSIQYAAGSVSSSADYRLHTADCRLYKTGDLARYRPDGAIEFLGRTDHQVKLRGFRIELGEIEAALRSHAGVREAAVVLREQRPGDQRLIAYIVPANDERRTTNEHRGLKIEDSDSDASAALSSIFYPLSSELRNFLKDKLPDFMMPSAFVLLDALPLTPNGKLDRKALPEPGEMRPAEETFVAPRTETERLLAEIWQQVLGRTQVGIHDHFFALGGHSLLIAQLMLRLRSEFQIDLPLRTMYEQPTIAEQALMIEELLLEEVAALSEEQAQELIAYPNAP